MGEGAKMDSKLPLIDYGPILHTHSKPMLVAPKKPICSVFQYI
jgi:hypothetical protein